MKSIIWKSRQNGNPSTRAGGGLPQNALAAYVREYRKAMLATRKVEQMVGHLDRAALTIIRDYSRREH